MRRLFLFLKTSSSEVWKTEFSHLLEAVEGLPFAQRSCGDCEPGIVQNQVGCSLEQPGILEGASAQGRRAGKGWSLKSLLTQTIL